MNHLALKLDSWSSYALSLLRIVVALLFLQHGLSKAFGFPSPAPASFSGLILVAALLETLGPLALIAGFQTRVVALLLSGEMAVAYFMSHAPKSFYPLLNGGESAVLFCFVFLFFVFAGGGAWSVDRVLFRQR